MDKVGQTVKRSRVYYPGHIILCSHINKYLEFCFITLSLLFSEWTSYWGGAHLIMSCHIKQYCPHSPLYCVYVGQHVIGCGWFSNIFKKVVISIKNVYILYIVECVPPKHISYLIKPLGYHKITKCIKLKWGHSGRVVTFSPPT